ncbi:MAG: hypothetical protein U0452_10730 [Anaerolineae bacterium]
MNLLSTPEAAARALNGARIVSAELLYQPRPAGPNARAVFDHALRARLSSLTVDDGLLLFVDGPETLRSVMPLLDEFPLPRRAALVVNPAPLGAAPETPHALGWETPEDWQSFQTTDRWARLLAAFEVAAHLGGDGWLALPALDAVYGRPLLDYLIAHSHRLGRDRPAAVSPVTPFQHYRLPGVRIPSVIIDALNVAFNRDETLPARLAEGSAQGVWGKMSLIPRSACSVILDYAETSVWEDDREIDRVLREAGWVTRGLWIRDPALYHQTPPVFDREALKSVILRALHYSLHIPAAVPAGTSILLQPMRPFSAEDSIWYFEARRLADDVTDECMDEISARVARFGASWVDWGAYRYVARVGDPAVEVWRKS